MTFWRLVALLSAVLLLSACAQTVESAGTAAPQCANSPVSVVAHATLPEGTLGAVALASADDARTLFNTFGDQWQRCGDKRVVKSNGIHTENLISHVSADRNVLTAAILMTTPSTGRQTLFEGALGVAQDCIVDVKLPVSDSATRSPDAKGQAAQLVQLMLPNVDTARR